MMSTNCEICKEISHKYKCPKCLVKYCSVGCFKVHKASACVPISKEIPKQLELPPVKKPTPKEDGELSASDSEDTEDKVPQDRLNKLSACSEVKQLLENAHLQQMLLRLDQTDAPQLHMEQAMHEPIFTEFADACLRVVEPEKYQSDCLSL